MIQEGLIVDFVDFMMQEELMASFVTVSVLDFAKLMEHSPLI